MNTTKVNGHTIARISHETKLTELTVILEIASHPNGSDAPRFRQAIADLQRARIAGCAVILVVHDHGRSVGTVPCFGHSNQCTPECRDVMPSSVKQYFGVRILTVGEPPQNALGRYRLNTHAQLHVCSMSVPQASGELVLTRIEESCHAG